MQTMLDSFYRVLKDRTGVDITPAPYGTETVPAYDPVTQYQTDSKDSISQLSDNRSYERTNKRAQRFGKPEGKNGTPSLYEQAAQASSGNTLLNRY